jgi:hypothetical protein
MSDRGRRPPRHGMRAAGFVLALAAAVAAGCAPRPSGPPTLDVSTLRVRFERALDARESRAAALEADLTVWPEAERTGPLPGFRAALTLAAPQAFRLRVESLFGTALDLGVRGDSVVAWVPSRRAAVRADATRDSIGLSDPGAMGVRVWAASFRPPASAWDAATVLDSLRLVRWAAGPDSFTLAVAESGLPRALRVARAGRGSLRAQWTEWTTVSGLAWPSRLDVEDGAGQWSARCRIQRVRFVTGDGSARTIVPVPPDAESIGWADLRRAFERGEVLP